MTELAPVADDFRPYAPPAKGDTFIQLGNLDTAMQAAEQLSQSALVPKHFQRQPANVLVALLWAKEMDVPPMQALQCIAVVNGKPSIYGDVGKALVLRRTGVDLTEFKLWSEPEGQAKDAVELRGRCRIVRANPNGEPIVADKTFSWEEAQRAGLTKSHTYQNYPRRMLEWRAFWLAARDAYADLFSGLSAAEEMEDINTFRATAKVIDKANPTATLENTLGVGKDEAPVVDVVPEPESDPTEDCRELFDTLDLKTEPARKDYIVSTGLPHEQEWTSLPEKDLIELRDCLRAEAKTRG